MEKYINLLQSGDPVAIVVTAFASLAVLAFGGLGVYVTAKPIKAAKEIKDAQKLVSLESLTRQGVSSDLTKQHAKLLAKQQKRTAAKIKRDLKITKQKTKLSKKFG